MVAIAIKAIGRAPAKNGTNQDFILQLSKQLWQTMSRANEATARLRILKSRGENQLIWLALLVAYCYSFPMDQAESMNTLAPSLLRAFIRVFLLILAVTTFGAVYQRYSSGVWWSPDYFVSLIIPLLFVPTCVCLMFVPRWIRWSKSEFHIQPRFGAPRCLSWATLYAFGNCNNVFLLQFTGVATFQILAGAFDPVQWKAFRAFIDTNHSEKKALLWLGPKAIRRK
jgi:hypothetical protein